MPPRCSPTPTFRDPGNYVKCARTPQIKLCLGNINLLSINCKSSNPAMHRSNHSSSHNNHSSKCDRKTSPLGITVGLFLGFSSLLFVVIFERLLTVSQPIKSELSVAALGLFRKPFCCPFWLPCGPHKTSLWDPSGVFHVLFWKSC